MLGTLSNRMRLDWRSLAKSSQTCTSLRCTGLSSVHRTVSGAQAGVLDELVALRKSWGSRGYNSPDYPVCTRLSDMPAARPANGQPRDQRAPRGSANGQQVAPDCPVCHEASGWQRSASPKKEGHRALFIVVWCTGLSGAPTDRRQSEPFSWSSNGS